jgi:hypothetical protein
MDYIFRYIIKVRLIKYFQIIGLSIATILLSSCADDKVEIDTEYPEIDITYQDAFPKQCSVVERGETMAFSARFMDNMELGGFSIDVHHNFDHHTHSTEVNDCDTEPVKEPVNPFKFINGYDIPEGSRDYTAEMELEIPEDIDTGDYHFMILLTDAEGWQTIKGLSIKIE